VFISVRYIGVSFISVLSISIISISVISISVTSISVISISILSISVLFISAGSTSVIYTILSIYLGVDPLFIGLGIEDIGRSGAFLLLKSRKNNLKISRLTAKDIIFTRAS
jgi:hypothetical protein